MSVTPHAVGRYCQHVDYDDHTGVIHTYHCPETDELTKAGPEWWQPWLCPRHLALLALRRVLFPSDA